MKENQVRSCIDCGSKSCERMDGANPPFCLTTGLDQEVLEEAMLLYTEDDWNAQATKAAAEVEAEYYCEMTRVEEIMEFARRLGAKRIGIATCIGLLTEARTAARIFRRAGFEVYGVACKVGAQPKTAVGIPEACEKVGKNMCNPILQAKLLNRAKTDLNVVIGLCVGHDSLFYKMCIRDRMRAATLSRRSSGWSETRNTTPSQSRRPVSPRAMVWLIPYSGWSLHTAAK